MVRFMDLEPLRFMIAKHKPGNSISKAISKMEKNQASVYKRMDKIHIEESSPWAVGQAKVAFRMEKAIFLMVFTRKVS